MATVFLVEGPVGAGKSTFSQDLSQKLPAPHMNLDAWMARLFRPDRPTTGVIEWYVERKARCLEQIWDVALQILNSGSDVILELGLVQSASRMSMYDEISRSGHDLKVYVLDAPRAQRWERVKLRNLVKGSTYSMEVPEEIFEVASSMWEEPDEQECSNQDVVFVTEAAVDEAFRRIL